MHIIPETESHLILEGDMKLTAANSMGFSPLQQEKKKTQT